MKSRAAFAAKKFKKKNFKKNSKSKSKKKEKKNEKIKIEETTLESLIITRLSVAIIQQIILEIEKKEFVHRQHL